MRCGSADERWLILVAVIGRIVSIALLAGGCAAAGEPAELMEAFGEQLFVPEGGFALRVGQPLPELVWEDPDWIAENVGEAPIRTRWFNERFEETTKAAVPGRYYAYGEASSPDGPDGLVLRRAMTCVAVSEAPPSPITSEEAAVALAARMDAGGHAQEPRTGQWMMENATRHVRLKRKLMGFDARPPVVVKPRTVGGEAAPVLRQGDLKEAGVDAAKVRRVEERLDAWYAAAKEPTAIVIARNGVIVVEKAYGELDGTPATVDTPMLLHSAMKPLIGLQLAMYVDRGHVDLDEPLGDFLPDFDTDADQRLTFRAGQVHATGIHFPWEIAFERLFYFRSWHDSMIAFRQREWAPGERHKYGVVGIILGVRTLELLSGENYWQAMERELFEPLGIRNILPGGTGFSAENLARVGVLLANHSRYGNLEFFSEQTYEAILPTPLKPYFPNIDMRYGIGLRDSAALLGPGSYGHAGGCGTQILVNADKHLVFAMVRNERGEGYKQHLAGVATELQTWGE